MLTQWTTWSLWINGQNIHTLIINGRQSSRIGKVGSWSTIQQIPIPPQTFLEMPPFLMCQLCALKGRILTFTDIDPHIDPSKTSTSKNSTLPLPKLPHNPQCSTQLTLLTQLTLHTDCFLKYFLTSQVTAKNQELQDNQETQELQSRTRTIKTIEGLAVGIRRCHAQCQDWHSRNPDVAKTGKVEMIMQVRLNLSRS